MIFIVQLYAEATEADTVEKRRAEGASEEL
jgi:hypothetical protein